MDYEYEEVARFEYEGGFIPPEKEIVVSETREVQMYGLSLWGETMSAQVRDYQGGTQLAMYHVPGAPRAERDDIYILSVADTVLLRDLLNDATDAGYLSAERVLPKE